MATAVKYQLTGNSAKGTDGRIQEINATVQVTGISATDHTWVDQVLAATNMPQFGDILILASGERLLLSDITPELIDGEITKAMVALVYKRRDGSSEETGETPVLSGGSSIKFIETAKDRDGNPIEVEHTWPADSKATFPDGTPKRGKTERIGARINVPKPMNTISASFYKQTTAPGALTAKYAGAVNSAPFQSGDARTWMCTEGTFRLIDNSGAIPIYEFSFTHEYDEDTWDDENTAFFIDPQTGLLPEIDPANLPLPNGKEVVQVPYAREVDFNDDF